MSTHKYIDRICLAGALLSLLVTLLFTNGQALGLQSASRTMGYESRLFDTSRVHTIDIVMDDWDSFIDSCENEEYAACAAVIDNEAYKNVAIRAKGNTSLSSVSQMGSDRYSFKIEFDHYESGKTYYGLDKLSLNNLIQDNTMMKDYLTYRMMAGFGANAPLCSFVYITVNGEDWGLYLAVEGLEDGFLQRNYGQNYGNLYKPDSMSFGGGRGNGRDFDMEDFMGGNNQEQGGPGGMDSPGGGGFEPGGMSGGMGSSDVKLQYIDDDPDSYANIFDSAKTEVTDADQARLIQSLKALSEGGDVSEVLDVDQVLRYFVVHNFVVNGDSYIGSMVHNYYLYEEDGKLSMLPWDYNLAYGTFQGGDASSSVNDPIDSPLSVTGNGDRPMADWIFSSEEYTRLYHQYFEDFLNTVKPDVIIDEAYALIASYVAQDPTKFCTYEEFETGVEALKTFCALRIESVSGQLSGAIPATSTGQTENRDVLVDASALAASDMGTMGSGSGNGGGFGGRPDISGGPGSNEDSGPDGGIGGRPFDESGDRQPSFGEGAPTQPDSAAQPPDEGTPPSPSADGEAAPTQSADDEAPASQPGDEGTNTPDGQFPGGQRPEGIEAGNFGGRFPGEDFGGNIPGENVSQIGTSLILLGFSVLVLLAGLAVAFKFRR